MSTAKTLLFLSPSSSPSPRLLFAPASSHPCPSPTPRFVLSPRAAATTVVDADDAAVASKSTPSLPFCISHSFDLHRLEPGYPLIIGDISVPHDRGCEDADIVERQQWRRFLRPLQRLCFFSNHPWQPRALRRLLLLRSTMATARATSFAFFAFKPAEKTHHVPALSSPRKSIVCQRRRLPRSSSLIAQQHCQTLPNHRACVMLCHQADASPFIVVSHVVDGGFES